MTHYTAGFLFNRAKTKVALILKTKPTWQRGKFNAIGGKVEDIDYILPGCTSFEASLNAQRREFREETGHDVRCWYHFCTLTKQASWTVAFFYATGNLKKLRSTTKEKVFVFDCYKVPGNAVPNVKWLLPMALSMPEDECSHFEVIEI